jgi:putative ABC transport system permease protein
VFRHLSNLFEYLFRRRRLEDDLDEELRSSFEMIVDRFVRDGMPPAQARRAARLEFEGLEQVKEKVRDGLAGSGIETFLQDLRYAWRGLRNRPSFAIIALVTLALGIGVNTAVFSVFYGVLMRPLPYDQPERLVLIWARLQSRGTAQVAVNGVILYEIEQLQRTLADLAGIWVTPPRTFPGDPPQQVKSAFVTTNFFDVLGVRAAYGRTFVSDDTGGPSVILDNGFFRRRFDANTDFVGTDLAGQGAPNTLTGVLPAEFQLHFAPEANVPSDVQVFQTWGPGLHENPNYIIRIVARLKPEVSIEEAQRDMDRIAEGMRDGYPEFSREDLHLTVTGMQSEAFRDVRPALTALFAGGTFVLLICCVNVTSLLLARASDRRKEIALRLALGASRGRILRQLLAEAGLLSMLGGIAGGGMGWIVFRGLLAIRPERLARIDDAGVMWPVLAFASAASLAAAVLVGLAPSLQIFQVAQIETLRSRNTGWLSRLHRRAGRLLVCGEIAVGFVLVTGAALTARTLSEIERVRPGFEPRQVLAFQLPGLPAALLNEWEARFAALPGVDRAGAISHLPLDNTLPNWYGEYRVKQGNRVASFTADSRAVTPGYLSTMGVRLVEGRYLGPQDRAGAPYVVIVDESLAESTWPGESPIGKTIEAEHMMSNGFQFIPSVVVGVVEHVHNHSITREVRGQIYSPFEQNQRGGYPQTFVLRTRVDPLSLVPAVRASLRERNPNVSMDKIRPMTEYVDREIAPAGFTAVLAAIFGGLALLLAATGIYGVFNFQVSRRLPEMGIRMAVGATTADVLGLILREGLTLAALGVLAGLAAAQGLSRWLSALLYGVTASDPLSYGLALLLLPAAAMLGCWRPAWRAAAANPSEIIRQE